MGFLGPINQTCNPLLQFCYPVTSITPVFIALVFLLKLAQCISLTRLISFGFLLSHETVTKTTLGYIFVLSTKELPPCTTIRTTYPKGGVETVLNVNLKHFLGEI